MFIKEKALKFKLKSIGQKIFKPSEIQIVP